MTISKRQQLTVHAQQPIKQGNQDAQQDRTQQQEPIAIVGIGCRFPGGATSPTAFWHMLCAGTDATRDVPPDRWDIDTFFDPDPARPGKVRVHRGGFLEQIDQFDAAFFGISPREADCLDPQQRLLLEIAWEAFEDAGILPEHVAGSQTGVFIGAFTLDYKILQFNAGNRELIDANTAAGSMMTMVSNRLSYTFDLRGPSLSVDTACSSSLVAVHLACQSLWRNECTLALAGGVNVMITPEYAIAESKGGFLAPDGRCKAFDARANGYARGEGAGIVVLKPLALAQTAGDSIYAVIRGTAANQDGHSNGITVPRREAQEALMRTAYANAGVIPGQVQYVEAHGTGTPVGDPIEANALGTVLAEGRPAGNRCIIGSVKTNIGHLEAGAGIAGLIKATLCLRHRAIPPHLNLETPNPNIDFTQLPLRIPQRLEPWPEHEGPALAGVNSFGFGGTNAHVVLAEAPEPASVVPVRAIVRGAELLPLSARSPEALHDLARSYQTLLADAQETDQALYDLCATASLHRSQHNYRLALVADCCATLCDHLQAFLTGDTRPGMNEGHVLPGQPPKLVWVFTGMGPQWWAMGRQLLEEEPVFRNVILECDSLFSQYGDWSLLAELTAAETESRMHETQIAQPANFAIQVGLAALWQSWGITPDAVVGHSAGEVAAVYIAGVLTLEAATRVIFHRSRLQHRTTGQGQMVAVGVASDEAERLIAAYADRVSIAAINSPSSVTLAGDPQALAEIVPPLQEQNIFCRYLRVEVPYHSHYMEAIRADLMAELAFLNPVPATVPLYGAARGIRVDGSTLDATYWWENTRRPVLFAACVDALIEDGYTTFLEIGPHPVLAGAITECLAHRGKTGTIAPSIRRNENERATMLGSLGTLYTQGLPINWSALYGASQRRVPLPTYPWQRERYWLESEPAARFRLGYKDHPLLGRPLDQPLPTWELELNRRVLPYLDDHRIQGAVVYPGAGYIEMGLAVGRLAFGAGGHAIEEVVFHKAMFLPDHASPLVQVRLDPATATFSIYSRLPGTPAWTLNGEGKLRQRQEHTRPAPIDVASIHTRCDEELAGATCYAQFTAQGFHYGSCFQGIARLWRGVGEALARMESGTPLAASPEYQLHPTLLDACFQVLIAINPNPQADQDGVYLPVGIDRIRMYERPYTPLWCHARLVERNAHVLCGDIDLIDSAGNLLVEVRGFRAQALERGVGSAIDQIDETLYELVWQAQDREFQAIEARTLDQRATWLVLTDAQVGPALIAHLEQYGESCVRVFPGSSYQVLEPGRSYQINPAATESFTLLLQDVQAHDLAPIRHVIHLWGLEGINDDDMTVSVLETAQIRGSLAVMHLIQSLVRADCAPRLWLVTRGAQAVASERTDRTLTATGVSQAPLWGLGRVIGYQEHVALWGGAIDLDPDVPAEEATALLSEIWEPTGEDQLAFRAGQRYIARLLPCQHLTPPLPPHFRRDASYLITGAFGALGLLVARWMVTQGARHLILLGRTPVPPRAEWQQVAPDTPAAERIAAIRELEALGAYIHLAPIDVADERQLVAFLTDYQQEGWPPIRGVIHSAGVVRDQLLLQMDDETFTSVVHPKLLGAWALHRCLQDTPLDFFILFSSVASQVVSTGQANYAAGNAFLDALAEYRRCRGLPALSINWGPWAVGMVSALNLIEHYARRGMAAITPELGMQVLGRLLGQNVAGASVLIADWPLVLEYYPQPPALFAHLGQQAAAEAEAEAFHEQSFAQRVAQADPEQRLELVIAQLQELAARVLRMDRTKLDIQQPLNTLGMNSMMAIELKNRIDLTLGVTVAVVELLQGLGIAQLAARVLNQIEIQIENTAREALLLEGPITTEVAQKLAEHVDEDTLAELLHEVEQLSEDEAQAILTEQQSV